MTEKTEIPLTTITTNFIYKLHPKIVTIGVSSGHAGLTTINLPITSDVYKTLLQALPNPKLSRWLPLVFYIDNKGIAYRVIPRELADKEKEQAKTQTEPSQSKNTEATK